MANTFELIASSTVGAGGAASIDFTSIPSTYTDLCLVASTRSTNNAGSATGNIMCVPNGWTTGFSFRGLYGSGSSVGSYSGTSLLGYAGETNGADSTANTFGSTTFYFPNYAGSTNKSVGSESVSENNATQARADLDAGLWTNTAAITSLSVKTTSGQTFVQYSTAYLYGVKNA